jgi:hypothetical protein
MAAGRWGSWGGLLVAALVAGGCSPRGEEHVYEDGRFRVAFPGTPKVEELNDPARTNAKKASLTTRHGALSLVWEDVKAKGAAQADQRLDHAANAAVVAVSGKVRSRKKIPLATVYPGLELLVESPEGKLLMEVRLFLARGRLYQLMAAGPAWWIESPEARQFFRSFELLEE